MKIIKFKTFFPILAFLSLSLCSEKFITINCVLHIHSNYSGSKYTIEEIVELCKKNNIDAVVLTDHYLQKVEFGLWPFRGSLKKSVSLASVMKIGLEKYINEIDKVNSKQKNVILIPGVEVTPHYFWSTQYEKNELIINNLHKHMLIIADDKNFYINLPVINNENINKVKILYLWPLVVLLAGVILKLKTIIFFSLILLAINYPFKYYQYHQYKNFVEKPYQNLIDYVNNLTQIKDSNYIIIWAHPEACNYEKKFLIKSYKKLKIYTQTKPYYDSLIKTYNYDGFSIFPEGYRKIGNICGIWDFLLTEYCQGKRKKPIFCYSELDFGETIDPINIRKNVLYVEEKNYKNIVSALKNGNFYSLWCSEDEELILKNFKFCNKERIWGNKYKIDDNIISIDFEIVTSTNKNLLTKIYIIRNNNVVLQKEITTPAKITFKEQKPKEMSYYRIYIESKYPHKIATNPIFVE
ncbi:MAG: PHP domain-containing protein [Endomicrobiia bacterium]